MDQDARYDVQKMVNNGYDSPFRVWEEFLALTRALFHIDWKELSEY